MDHLLTSRFDELFVEAEKSSRRRSHLNLHACYEDKVQRLLIAMVCGSYVEPHYHELPHQWELFTVLQGIVRVDNYSKCGEILSSRYLGEGQDSMMVTVQPHEIHSVECISDKALLLEVKEGPFEPKFAKTFPKFFEKESNT
ncbi:WbuC family cupin fold metalloprotein [Vibrio sp. 1731]|uniref:WbuC family cupin fold metalloprotein n=1 Tax=Vibrio sp. 1731 TaxID=3074573 RepID=UPI0021CE483E|nr:WbuC family cupin fold metalloprotein [Vibrio sp. 1731]MDW2113362.1 WbuC family cupin fold metalloprotein [Vibrio sp. 1731]